MRVMEVMLSKPVVPRGLEPMRVTGEIEPWEAGDWKCETFEVAPADMWTQYDEFFRYGRWVPPGTYTRLLHNGNTIMSDTPDELEDHRRVVEEARGSVLIAGLGLGCVVKGLLSNPDVDSIDVVEIDDTLITVMPKHALWLQDPRVNLHHASIFTWGHSGRRWDFAWFDIWPDISPEQLEDIKRLNRKFRRPIAKERGHWAEAVARSIW